MGLGIDPLKRQSGLMAPSSTASFEGRMDVTATINAGWQYERPVWVRTPEPVPPDTLPAAEEPPEVEPLLGKDEYRPLALESHESFSARLSRRKE